MDDINGLVDQENGDLNKRVFTLEAKVLLQNDELTCLKAALAECLRRINSIENNKSPNHTIHVPGAAQNQHSFSATEFKANDISSSFSNLASPPNHNIMDANNQGRTPSSSLRRSTSSSISLTSPRSRSELSNSKSTNKRQEIVSSVGSPIPPNSTPRSIPRSGSVASPATTRTAILRSSQNNLMSSADDMTRMASAKEAVWIREEGILRIFLRGRSINMYAPSCLMDFDLKAVGDKPKEQLKMEWVYGYRGRDCRSNVHYLPTGEVMYFIAAVVVLFNVEEQTQRHYLGHNDDVKCMAVHPDRITIATGQVAGHDKNQGKQEITRVVRSRSTFVWPFHNWPHIRVWNSVNLTTLHVLGLGDFERAVCCVAFSKADGGDLLCAVDEANEHVISVWDWKRESKITETKSSSEPVLATEFHPLQRNCIVTAGKNMLFFWSLDGCQLSKRQAIFDKQEKPKYVLCLAFAQNGDLVTGDSNGNILVWANGTQRISQALLGAHDGPVFSVCFLKDDHLVSGGKDRQIVHWDTAYNRSALEALLPEQFGPIRVLTQGPGNMILAGTTRNSLLQGSFDLQFRPVVEGHMDELWGLACHPSRNQFITAGADKLVIFWDAASHEAVWSKELNDAAHCVSFHPQGDLVCIGTQTGRWLVLDVLKREIASAHSDGQEQIECVMFSPNGTQLALGSRDSYIYVYNVLEGGRTYSRLGKCSGHSSSVLHLDWSSDGQYLRSCSADYELLFWTTNNARQVTAVSTLRDVDWATQFCTLSFETAGIWPEGADGTDINAAVCSHKRQLLASADDFGKVNLFRYPAYQPKSQSHTYCGHSSHVTNVQFVQDDTRLISTGGNDMAVIQWEICEDL